MYVRVLPHITAGVARVCAYYTPHIVGVLPTIPFCSTVMYAVITRCVCMRVISYAYIIFISVSVTNNKYFCVVLERQRYYRYPHCNITVLISSYLL